LRPSIFFLISSLISVALMLMAILCGKDN
jgi:hypothetical protein